jgi:hypothetical protein
MTKWVLFYPVLQKKGTSLHPIQIIIHFWSQIIFIKQSFHFYYIKNLSDFLRNGNALNDWSKPLMENT